MITVISWENRERHFDLIEKSFALRHKIFKERLNWDVETYNQLEFDEFDASPGTLYLVHTEPDGSVSGCARLLPTTGPNMLRDVFPVLLDDRQAPCSPRIWESTRFAVNLEGKTNAEFGLVTKRLLDAMCEVGLAYGLEKIVSVTDPVVERILKLSGLKTERLGRVHQYGVSKAVAGQFSPSEAVLMRLRQKSRFTHSQIKEAAWITSEIAA